MCIQYPCLSLCLVSFVLTVLTLVIGVVAILFSKNSTTISTTLTTTTATTVTTTTTTTTTSTTSTSTTTTTTTGSPGCSTCIVTYTNSIGVAIGNITCDDACHTTHYYNPGGGMRFPSTNSSCLAGVSTSSSGFFCSFQLPAINYFYSTDNNIYYYGPSYNNYSYGPNPGISYNSGYLASCTNYNSYYCCCA